MRWLVDLFTRLQRRDPPPLAPIDRMALREEMTRDDPEFARVRRVQHDLTQPIAAKRLQDGIAIRRERKFWQDHGHQQDGPPK